jgi:hypothetical protein
MARKRTGAICTDCGKLVAPGKPMVALDRIPEARRFGASWWQVCVPCDRKRQRREAERYGRSREAYALPDLQQPCPACGRPMFFRGCVWRPVACGYECAARAKIAKQLAQRRVEPQPKQCVSCGKSFTPKRADAVTCGNACRQRLFRLNHRAAE